jgi:N-acyl-L-homoserine lactone synthetase
MFTFKIVDNKELLYDNYKFRYKIMHYELGHLKPNKNEIDIDEYDKYSIHFVALDKNKNICATIRLIINSNIEYPTPKYMNINLDLQGIHKPNFAELSRGFIDKKIRNLENSRIIIHNFIALMYPYLKSSNIHFIYAALEKKFIRLLQMINVDFNIIGNGGNFYGFRYPCITTIEGLSGKNPYIKQK